MSRTTFYCWTMLILLTLNVAYCGKFFFLQPSLSTFFKGEAVWNYLFHCKPVGGITVLPFSRFFYIPWCFTLGTSVLRLLRKRSNRNVTGSFRAWNSYQEQIPEIQWLLMKKSKASSPLVKGVRVLSWQSRDQSFLQFPRSTITKVNKVFVRIKKLALKLIINEPNITGFDSLRG